MTEHSTEYVRLSEDERMALSDSLCVRHDFVDEDGNPDYVHQVGHLQHVQPAVERIIAARVAQAKAEAWDEGERAGFTAHQNYSDQKPVNPYRDSTIRPAAPSEGSES